MELTWFPDKLASMKKIAVFTSGGDAPGMNAAIRAVVRTTLYQNVEVAGIIGGFEGLLNGDVEALSKGSVANTIQRGGTILKTGRCPDFLKAESRTQAAENLKTHGIDGLICIGGDGSFCGASALFNEHNIPVVGVPGTIDNDIFGTDYTIGFDTAVNTGIDAVDRIRDTAASHDRLFIVEVMGRNSGFLALEVGLAVGAEEVFIPEIPVTVDQAIEHIKRGMNRGKGSSILITAEGQKPGRAYDLAENIRKKSGFESKVCILGHIQRGGKPTAMDRNLASRMGAAAVNALLSGQSDVFIGYASGKLVTRGLTSSVGKTRMPNADELKLTQILSC